MRRLAARRWQRPANTQLEYSSHHAYGLRELGFVGGVIGFGGGFPSRSRSFCVFVPVKASAGIAPGGFFSSAIVAPVYSIVNLISKPGAAGDGCTKSG
jgi:hypothetical protein